MRLTKKIFTDLYASPCDEDTEEKQAEQQWKVCNKLGQLEDIEDELGIDLITLFKAYHDGFYIKYEDGLTGFIHGGEYYLEVCFETKCFKIKEFEPDGTKWYFKDYSKTWALTREELEK